MARPQQQQQQQKRKAEELTATTPVENKTHATYSTKAPAKQPKKTTPGRGKSNTMTEEEQRPAMVSDMKSFFKEMTSSLTTQLTNKMTEGMESALGVLGTRVTQNSSHTGQIQQAVDRKERRSEANNARYDKKILERIESLVLAARTGRNSDGSDTQLAVSVDMLVDERRQSEVISCQERFATARRSLRIWPVQGNTDQRSDPMHCVFFVRK